MQGFSDDRLIISPRLNGLSFSFILVFNRPGSDLLSHALRRSTIGAEELNGRVRDGIGFGLLAITTRPVKDKDKLRSWILFRDAVARYNEH